MGSSADEIAARMLPAWIRLVEEVLRSGGSIADLDTLGKDRLLLATIAEDIRGQEDRFLELIERPETDLSKLLASGNYASIEFNFQQYATQGDLMAPGLLLHIYELKRMMSTDGVVNTLRSLALRPATLIELLLYGSARPDVHHGTPVIALDSVFELTDGRRGVPRLSFYGGRKLDLVGLEEPPISGIGIERVWPSSTRFLAVSEK